MRYILECKSPKTNLTTQMIIGTRQNADDAKAAAKRDYPDCVWTIKVWQRCANGNIHTLH